MLSHFVIQSLLQADASVPASPILSLLVDNLPRLLELVVIPFIISWLRAHTKSAKLGDAITSVEELAHSTIAEVDATLRPELEAAMADGVLTDEEKAKLKDSALTLLKKQLPAATEKILKSAFGSSIETWLAGWVERALSAKRAEEAKSAGVDAASKIDSIAAAVAEFNKRLDHVDRAVAGAKP